MNHATQTRAAESSPPPRRPTPPNLRIPIGEARELPHHALTPAELDSFFGATFPDTVPAALAQ